MSNTKRRLVAVSAVWLLLVATASQAGKPEWVGNKRDHSCQVAPTGK